MEFSSGWNFFSSQSWKVWYVTVRKGAQLMFITLDKNTLYHLCSYKSTNNYDISLLSTFPSAWRGTEVYLLKEERIHISWFSLFMKINVHFFRPKDPKKTNVFALSLMPSLTSQTFLPRSDLLCLWLGSQGRVTLMTRVWGCGWRTQGH